MIANVLTIEGGNPDAREGAVRNLNEVVIPALRALPGFVAGYWMDHPSGGGRLTVMLWDDEKSLRAAEEQMKERREQTLKQFGMRVTKMETYSVVAHGTKTAGRA